MKLKLGTWNCDPMRKNHLSPTKLSLCSFQYQIIRTKLNNPRSVLSFCRGSFVAIHFWIIETVVLTMVMGNSRVNKIDFLLVHVAHQAKSSDGKANESRT